MDLKNFGQAIDQLAEEKGVSKEKILETIEMAIAAAYKKDYCKRGQIVKAKLDPVTGDLKFTQIKIVVYETMIKSEEEIKAEEEARAEKFAEAAAGISAEEKEKMEKRGKREREVEEDPEPGMEEKRVRFNPEK